MMEVAAGPTVVLKEHGVLPGAIMHGDNEKRVAVAGRRSNGFCFVSEEEEDKVDVADDDSSSESSSIGAESSSEEVDDDAQSQLKSGPLGSLDSLEDSLPIKRGLSNYFTGKSKSFASLADVHVPAASAGELAKPENPFNKRRRILMACKSSWSRRASYSSLLPPLPAEDDEETDSASLPPLPRHLKEEEEKKKTFRSPRSFSLSDLQRV